MKKILFSLIVLAYFLLNSQTYAIWTVNNVYYWSSMYYENKLKADKIVDSLINIIEKNGWRKWKKYSLVTKALEKYYLENIAFSTEENAIITYIRVKLENHFYDNSLLKWNLIFEDNSLNEGGNEINLDFNNPIIKAKCGIDLNWFDYTIETNSWVVYTNSVYWDWKNRCNIDLTYMLDDNDLTEFKLNINWYNSKPDNTQDYFYEKNITVKIINKKIENKATLLPQSNQEEKIIKWIRNSLEYKWKTYVDILNINQTWSTEKNYFENIKSLEIKCSEDLYSLELSPIWNPSNITYSSCNYWKSTIQIPENDGSEKVDYVLKASYYNQITTTTESSSMVPVSDTSINTIEKYFSIEPKNKKANNEFKKELKIVDNWIKKELFFWDNLILSTWKDGNIVIEIINSNLKVVEFNWDSYLFFGSWNYEVLKQEITTWFYFASEKSTYNYIITQKWTEYFLYSIKDWNLVKEFSWKDIIEWKNISINYLVDYSDNYVTVIWTELNENFWDFYKTINLKR